MVRETIAPTIRQIFEEASQNNRTHQKNVVALFKVHERAAAGSLDDEKKFIGAVKDMMSCILGVRRDADKAVLFLTRYVRYVNVRAAQDNEDEPEELSKDKDIDTAASRFTENIAQFLLRGFEAGNMVVRYRTAQIFAELVNDLGQIDLDLYKAIRTGLELRLQDAKPVVRVQAATGLCKYAALDTEEVEKREEIVRNLLESLATDESAEVRRTIASNIPITELTTEPLIERARDKDVSIRRLVYTREEIWTHPRQCEAGLQDRDRSVRLAAVDLVLKWLTKAEDADDADVDTLVDFVAQFNLAVDDAEIGSVILLGLFTTKPEFFEPLGIDGEKFWDPKSESPTPAKALVGRCFIKHCIDVDKALEKEGKPPVMVDRKETALPTGSAMAELISNATGDLFALVRDLELEIGNMDDEEYEEINERKGIFEFVLNELLKVAAAVDYQEEVGRRKMREVVRNLLKMEGLLDRHADSGLDVLRALSPSEGDLIRQVAEIIEEIQDLQEVQEDSSEVEEDSETPTNTRIKLKGRDDMTPAEQDRYDASTLTSLVLLEGCLERCEQSLERNAILDGLIMNLVYPSLQRKDSPVFRERALVCLALVSCISRKHALGITYPSTIQLLRDASTSPKHFSDESRMDAVKGVFDLVMCYDRESYASRDEYAKYFLGFVNNAGTSPEMQAVLCNGLAKLVWMGFLGAGDDHVISTLMWMYFHPSMKENQRVQQCLAVFFPGFCFKRSQNQERVTSVFLYVFSELFGKGEKKEHPRGKKEREEEREKEREKNKDMLRFVDIVVQEWSSPWNIKDEKKRDTFVHLTLARDIVAELLRPHYLAKDSDHRKILFQALSKMSLPEPDEADQAEIFHFKIRMDTLHAKRPPREAAAKTSFTRFEKTFTKQFDEYLKDYSEEELRKLEEYQRTFEECDGIEVEAEEEQPLSMQIRKRSLSTTPAEDDVAVKRMREDSTSDDEGNDVPITWAMAHEEAATPQPEVVNRTRHEDDSEDDENEVSGLLVDSD